MPDLYTPQTWANGPGGSTPISAARLSHIENGINALDAALQTVGGSGTSSVFNVKAYAAVGDGSNDDTAEIQAAIDAAEATVSDLGGVVGDGDFAGGGIVYFPPGRYRITSTLTVNKSNIWLVGDGPASRIVWAGGGARMLHISAPSTPESGWLRRVAVKGLMFDGAASATNGIGIEYSVENLIEDCYVYRCSGSNGPGIELIQLAFCTVIRRTSVRRNGSGVKLGHFSNNVEIDGCRIQHNNTYGVWTPDGSFDICGVVIHGSDIEGNGGRGIYLGTARHRAWRIHGCYFEGNEVNNATITARREIELSSGTTADGVYIVGNYLDSAILSGTAPHYAVKIAAGQNVECFNAARGYATGVAEVTAGLLRVRVSQSVDGSSAPVAEYHGDDATNGESARVRFVVPGSDFTIGPGQPGQSELGWSIYNKLIGSVAQAWTTPNGNNESAALLMFWNDSATAVIQRVKRGASGTGPGGVGRMLYVDA